MKTEGAIKNVTLTIIIGLLVPVASAAVMYVPSGGIFNSFSVFSIILLIALIAVKKYFRN